jgi:CubicO group peptidase (beta-lactamase class C family)
MKRSFTWATTMVATAIVSTDMDAQGGRAAPEAIARAVDSLAARGVAAGLTPALGVAVVMDGRTILLKAYGQADVTKGIAADERTLWYLASTSKSLTGFGISLLATQSVVRFDAPITALLPNARWHKDARPSELTLASFLSHTHGLNDNAVVMSAAYTGAIPEAKWPEYLVYAVPTGSRDLVYSNLGYNVAAMVIDAKRREGWRRYLEQNVYAPAGMRETYARVSGLDRRRFAMPHAVDANGRFSSLPFEKTDVTMNSAGGHVSTLGDLARWVTVQMDSGVIEGRRVFPAEAVALSHRMIAPQTRDQAKTFAYFMRDGWAAGWDIGSYEGEPMVSRFGSYSTLRSHLSFLPRRRVGVVAMANGRPGWTLTDLIAALAYDLEAGRTDAPERADQRLRELVAQREKGLGQVAARDSVRASRQMPLDRPLNRFAGTYESAELGTISFAVRDGRLQYTWGVLSGPVEVFDAAKHQLRFEVAGTAQVAEFVFGDAPQAREVVVNGSRFARR